MTVRSPGACIIRGRIKPVEKARRKKAPGEGRRRESRASLQGKVRAVRQMPKKWAVAAPAGACRSAAEPPVRMPRRERGPFVRRCFFHSKCPAAFRRADAGVCRAKRRTKTAVRGRRVLLVELDSGLRSVDYIAGVYGKTVYDVEDVLNGRCEAGKAVVESPVYRNLYVISAPYSGGHILPAALRVFVEKVGPVFDTIVLDTAAGMGVPFEAAMGVAHRALLVLTPDPVSIRDGRIVCDALEAGGCPEIRLIINKVPRTLANCGIQSLDECIDTVGAQLIGVVPFSTEIQKAGATGAPLAPAGRPRLALRAIAARLCGQYTPLVIR